MKSRWTLTLPAQLKRELFAHLFPGDGDEHGAVIAAGVSETDRGIRLLARTIFLAKEGIDYVPGKRGYRMLTGAFVGAQIRFCRDESLAYLAVHNHGGSDRVAFSSDDLASHERGYPALLDIAGGTPVGALVFAQRAVAGDLWLSKAERVDLEGATVVGPSVERLYPSPLPRPSGVDATYDRQARLFGDAGQHLLAQRKVGVIGAGGVGALLVEQLSRLGVGSRVVVDPDRVSPSNLPRMPGATRWDAHVWMRDPARPEWLRRLGARMSTQKIDVMKRITRRANPKARFVGIFDDFTRNDVAMRFRDCDFLFLAADSFQARLVFNAMVHQYLIPGVQVGSKVRVRRETGEVTEVFAVSRPILPGHGCLWCNGLIPPSRLQQEESTEAELRAQRYVEESTIAAPSVITLNSVAASWAANDFLFSILGLRCLGSEEEAYFRAIPRKRAVGFDEPRRDPDCTECGCSGKSRFARGDSVSLPTRSS